MFGNVKKKERFMYYNGVIDYDKMSHEDFENLAKDRLVETRKKNDQRLDKDLPIDSVFPFKTDLLTGNRYSYADFLGRAALIDFALKSEKWEMAESAAALTTGLSPYKDDKRCVIILSKVLNEVAL